MVDEALKNPNTKNTTIYTRLNWIKEYDLYPRIKPVPDLPYRDIKRVDEPWHWGSGPYAVLLASLYNTDVHMIGFDLHGNDNLVNNVYKGTANYLTPDKPKVDPSYWVYQIGKIFEYSPKTNFTIYNLEHWQLPREWTFPNVNLLNIADFTMAVADLQT
jgi:hypothetical protein